MNQYITGAVIKELREQYHLQVMKLYPEGNAEARFHPRGVRQILFYCNQDGLFYVNRKKF